MNTKILPRPTTTKPETMTGDLSKFSPGTWRCDEYSMTMVIRNKRRGTRSLVIYDDGDWFSYRQDAHATYRWRKISDHYHFAVVETGDAAEIASITMAGRPLAGETHPKLSDPCHLKAGDWIQWKGGYGDNCEGAHPEPVQVSRVYPSLRGFTTNKDKRPWQWGMNGSGYTVVPAPEGEQP